MYKRFFTLSSHYTMCLTPHSWIPWLHCQAGITRKSKFSLQHFLTRNHSNLGMGSPVISRMTKACSPSVDENLSGGFTNFGSFPEADSGVEVLSQSCTQQLYSTQLAVPQSTYIRRVQNCVWRLPKYWPPAPSPPSECVLPPHQRRGVHTRRAVGGGGGAGGQYFGRRQP
jgi:hypothetical protein